METIDQDGRVARLTRQLVEFALHGKNSLPPSTLLDAARLIRTHLRLLAQPKSICSIIDATQREQQHGLASNRCVNRDGVPVGPHPAPVAPLADPSGREGAMGLVIVWTHCDHMHLRLFFGDLIFINHLLKHFFHRGFQRTVRHSQFFDALTIISTPFMTHVE